MAPRGKTEKTNMTSYGYWKQKLARHVVLSEHEIHHRNTKRKGTHSNSKFTYFPNFYFVILHTSLA